MTAGSPPAYHGALAAAARWRLPFTRQAWRGLAGNWRGVGAGSSLDFQDHRNYMPGDDPRHIHWPAFARTGALTMKLYRAEATPVVEIVVDVSASMSVTPAKNARVDELLAFCVECADKSGAPVRLRAVSGREQAPLSSEQVRAGRWRERLPTALGSSRPPGPLIWRGGAMKILISDLLFPGEPSTFLASMAIGSGTAIIFAPCLAEEADLSARGNIQLVDCESDAVREQRIDAELAGRYRSAYARHFALWTEACFRRGVLLARISSEHPLTAAFAGQAYSVGAIEAAV